MLMKLSRFSSRQSANRYWSLYLKSLWNGLLCHIRCVVLQLPFQWKEWSWARKPRNEIQCNLRHCLILIMWVQKMLAKQKSSILNFCTQLCCQIEKRFWHSALKRTDWTPFWLLMDMESKNFLLCGMIFVFAMFLGESNVKRGFNINDDIVVENLKESLISQRLIYDHMHAKEVGAHDIVLTDKLWRSCLAFSRKWKQILAENKKESIWKGKDEKKTYGRDRKSSATSLSSENNDKWAELGSHWVLLKGRRSWCRCADYCRQRKCIDKGNYRKEEVAGWVADRSKKTERKKKDMN